MGKSLEVTMRVHALLGFLKQSKQAFGDSHLLLFITLWWLLSVHVGLLP